MTEGNFDLSLMVPLLCSKAPGSGVGADLALSPDSSSVDVDDIWGKRGRACEAGTPAGPILECATGLGMEVFSHDSVEFR